ncbi:hypothetical protein IC582_000298 [Cucumis melo]
MKSPLPMPTMLIHANLYLTTTLTATIIDDEITNHNLHPFSSFHTLQTYFAFYLAPIWPLQFYAHRNFPS